MILKINESINSQVITTLKVDDSQSPPAIKLISVLDNEPCIVSTLKISEYTHPLHHPPGIITQDENNRFVTDTQIDVWNDKYTKAETDAFLNDRYTKEEIDTTLGDYYTKTESDVLFNNRYTKEETYSKDEIDTAREAIIDAVTLARTRFESVTLTSGQTVVPFTMTITLPFFSVHGDNCDNSTLIPTVDYVLDVNNNQITLSQSYPAGTVIVYRY